MIREKLHTVSDVADELGITTGRVRQICREFGIGEFIGRDRLLTQEEFEKIRNRPDRRKTEESAQSS